jgi:hypothetical protein
MNSNELKKILPKVIRSPISSAKWWWINRGNHKLAAVLNPQRRRSVKALEKYHNSHRGERCFILGNGPSLKETDLSLLRGEITFGLNRIYLLFDALGFTTTYLVVINTLVIEQFANEIQPLMLPKFVSWRGRHWISDSQDTFFLDTDYTPPPAFSEDVTGRVFEGATVTYVAMQLAFYMGFEEVILVGVDHSFSTEGTPNKTIVSQGDDPNHFAPEYFGVGISWQLPDLKASEFAYEMAREAYDRSGRRILDATIGGKLNVFPKVEYLKLFNPCADEFP